MKYVFLFILVQYSIVFLSPEHWLEGVYQRITDPRLSSVYERNGLEWAIFAISPTFWANGFVGIGEEIAYRGILYGALRKRFNPFAAIGLSSLLFGIGHPNNFITPMLMGVVASWLVERHHSIVPAIVFHIGWNYSVAIFTFFLSTSILTLKQVLWIGIGVAALGLAMVITREWLHRSGKGFG